jgi:hypothetical protein
MLDEVFSSAKLNELISSAALNEFDFFCVKTRSLALG